jgi:hypothetical protein
VADCVLGREAALERAAQALLPSSDAGPSLAGVPDCCLGGGPDARSSGRDVMDEVFADDAIVEYPQSGERMRGRVNIRRRKSTIPNCPR